MEQLNLPNRGDLVKMARENAEAVFRIYEKVDAETLRAEALKVYGEAVTLMV